MEKLKLPRHLIEEILKELPAKSLLRFKSVSKLWKSLICSAAFLKLHRQTIQAVGKKFLLLSTSDEPMIRTFLNYVKPSPAPCATLEPYLMLLDYDGASFAAVNLNLRQNLNFPSNRDYDRIKIVGSCDGIVALLVDEDLFLWNPLIGEHKKLPSPCTFVEQALAHRSVSRSAHHSFRGSGCGFGYDSSSDDYKLIIEILWNRQAKVIVIFSLKTESWRMIETPFPSFRETAIHLNESLHWSSNDKDIIDFDLKTETLGKIPVPNHLSNFEQLGAFDGKLCVTEYNYQRKQMQLWVMNKYGDEKSWTKLLTLDNKGVEFHPCDMPLCISKEMLLYI